MVPACEGAVSSHIGCSIYIGVTDPPQCACPPSANTTPPVGHYQQYFWILDNYEPKPLRSGKFGIKTRDTNTILIGVDINQVPSAGGELRSFRGSQDSRQFNPSMEIDFWAFDTDLVTLWAVIYNGDLSASSIQSLRAATQFWRPDTIISILSQFSKSVINIGLNYLGTIIGGVLGGRIIDDAIQAITGNCDGWVVHSIMTLNGSDLRAAGSAQNAVETQIYTFSGYESSAGCGAISQYRVQTRYGLKAYGGEIQYRPVIVQSASTSISTSIPPIITSSSVKPSSASSSVPGVGSFMSGGEYVKATLHNSD